MIGLQALGNEMGLLVVSEEDNQPLLLHRIKGDIYQRQGGARPRTKIATLALRNAVPAVARQRCCALLISFCSAPLLFFSPRPRRLPESSRLKAHVA